MHKTCKSPVKSSPPTNQHPATSLDSPVMTVAQYNHSCLHQTSSYTINRMVAEQSKNPITLHKLHSSRPADSVSEKLFITCLLLLCVCGSVAEWLGCWTCNQQDAGSNPSLSAVECNSGQVVNTRASVTKQYNLVPANGQ